MFEFIGQIPDAEKPEMIFVGVNAKGYAIPAIELLRQHHKP